MHSRSASLTQAAGKVLGAATLSTLAILIISAHPQNQPDLQISSPPNGATVPAGQTLSVTVTSPSGLTLQMVAVNGPDPIGFNVSATSAPAQFSIAIPADADAGPCALTANGVTQAGQQVVSAPVQIDIERSDPPASLSTLDSSSLVLESMGEQVHSIILARFADSTIVNVTRSTMVSFASSNTAVATVDSSGTVTAQSAGSATINVTYTLGSQSLQLPIPVTVNTPKLITSPASLSFSSQAVGTSSAAQQLTITNAASDPVSVLSVVPNGDFSETDNCVSSSPLAPAASCTVSVSFSPLVVGTRPGTLSVSNSANNASIVIALSGTGTVAPAPNISTLSPTSGPVGTSVTISGTNFGVSQGLSTVTFNGTASTPTSWSNASIVVPVPSGATSGNVVVTVGGVPSNGVTFTISAPNPPKITGISPQVGPGGTSVTLTGSGFGATQGSSSVTFNGTAGTIVSWSDTSIVVQNPLAWRGNCMRFGCDTATVVVTVNGVASNGVTFFIGSNT